MLIPGKGKSVQEADSDAQGDFIPVSGGLEQKMSQHHAPQVSCQQEMPQPLTLRHT